jgi:hypothetical protein
MDTWALYGLGPGSGQPWGIFSSQYTGTLQSVSLGTNGAAPSATATRGMSARSVRRSRRRASNELGELVIHTNPQVVGTFSTGLSTLNTYISPSSDVPPYWPSRASTAFSATETQRTSSAASSALVINPSRVILGLRQGLVLTQLSDRSQSSLQYGFVAYVRHWAFP